MCLQPSVALLPELIQLPYAVGVLKPSQQMLFRIQHELTDSRVQALRKMLSQPVNIGVCVVIMS